jgi:hypothetical protein
MDDASGGSRRGAAKVTFRPNRAAEGSIGMLPLQPTKRQERHAEHRSAARAAEAAAALDLVAERDPEIPTTYHLRSPDGATLSMGSPAMRRGLFRVEYVDWMRLRAKGDPSLPEGARIRPPIRTVWDWRDGLPGEAPMLSTPRGAPLVVESEDSFDLKRFVAWIDSFPGGVRLCTLSRDEVELRADGPATRDAAGGARRLFELVRF